MAENFIIENGRLVYAKGNVFGGLTGALTGLAANAIVAALRNVGPAELVIDSVDMAFATVTPSSVQTSGLMFALYKVPGFTALSNAGARATPPVPVRKRNNDHIVIPTTNNLDPKFDTAVQCQVGGTAALTGITQSPALVVDDPQWTFSPRMVAAGTAALFDGQERWEPKNMIPLSLGVDEGLIVTARLAFPTALAGQFFIGIDTRLA